MNGDVCIIELKESERNAETEMMGTIIYIKQVEVRKTNVRPNMRST